MYQEAMIGNFTNRFMTLSILLFAALASLATAQTKSLETAQNEAAASPDIEVAYDQTRYLTVASLKIDLRADNENLEKTLKKLDWTLESWFAIKGIDANPARVVLCSDSQSKRFLFQRSSDLSVKLDGEEILLGEPNRTSEYKGGKARERLCWEVDLILVEEFSAAASASFTIGPVSGVFSDATMEKFREYASIVIVEE